ncbi:hypothetical protein BAUCODRAFT_31497 [Baudoinia panamericana UAMH 10762]|uniref:Uncharacterized protein n=1 Tax=Baudoinia panamericana (strain UAMH 10762) TaxID=717646 RepID=M2NJ71_BAUPA|nr:uncharacterized protein BAUCODRAFT_31497 [Baudoinia panamericana UAMH 10762]EMC99175.1 hypothetical protein BAUCODRAFT_31497 [Baudoinia panamericana UAMH 10762]
MRLCFKQVEPLSLADCVHFFIRPYSGKSRVVQLGIQAVTTPGMLHACNKGMSIYRTAFDQCAHDTDCGRGE